MTTQNNKRNRGYVYAFCLYSALMLLQTPVANIGLIGAFGTMLLTVLCAVFGGHFEIRSFRGTKLTLLLFLFTLLFFCTSYGQGRNIGFLVKSLALQLFAIFLTGLNIDQRESVLIRKVFQWAVVIYAILIIRSCMNAGDARYYHGDISLFGTSLDPNFVGIPLVAALVFFIDNFLNEKRRVFSLVSSAVIVIAIMYTGSRGNMLCMCIGCACCLLSYLSQKKISSYRKLAICLMIFISIPIMLNVITKQFPDQWARMTTFGEGADNGRFTLWSDTLKVFTQSPIWGNGYRSMVWNGNHGTHNTYISILCDTGVMGILLWIMLLITLFLKARAHSKIFGIVLATMYIQITFLDAFENRPMWTLLMWSVLLPDKQTAAGGSKHRLNS